MVGAEQAIEIDRTEFELSPVRYLEARHTDRLFMLVWLSGWEREEGFVHAEDRSCDEAGWESPEAERFTSC